VQDQIAHPVGADRAPQQAPRTENGLLAHEVIQAAGAQAISQGSEPLQVHRPLVAEEIRHGSNAGK
jgi:hypothetical protein